MKDPKIIPTTSDVLDALSGLGGTSTASALCGRLVGLGFSIGEAQLGIQRALDKPDIITNDDLTLSIAPRNPDYVGGPFQSDKWGRKVPVMAEINSLIRSSMSKDFERKDDIVERLNRHSADCSGHEPSLSLLQRTADEAANEIAASRSLVAELLEALQLARTFLVDFEGLPTWDAQNPLLKIDAAIAKATP